jgi:hypothetical protein
MRQVLRLTVILILAAGTAMAAPKVHVITFGKWTAVKWFSGPDEGHGVDLKVRPLYVDGQLKEFTLGSPHEITDRLFVARRVFRVNDTLPQETVAAPRWRWERGGWLLVDRVSGHVSPVNLPEFDPFYSAASWYRDYVAYCGVSDDGKKVYAMVVQLGRRKPILKKPLGEAGGQDVPDSECSVPAWQRQPVRVTFAAKEDQKTTYAVHGHVVDTVNADEDEEGTE